MASAKITGPSVLRIMSGIERAIIDGRRQTLQKAALAGKAIHAAEISRATGGDSHLSGVGIKGSHVSPDRRGKGAAVGVRFDMSGGSFDPEASLKATGPLQFVENDMAGHVVRSRYVRGYKRRGFIGPTTAGQFKKRSVVGPSLRPVINIPGVGHRAWARHPGTRGKHPWQKGKERARPVETRIMRTSTFEIIKKAAKP